MNGMKYHKFNFQIWTRLIFMVFLIPSIFSCTVSSAEIINSATQQSVEKRYTDSPISFMTPTSPEPIPTFTVAPTITPNRTPTEVPQAAPSVSELGDDESALIEGPDMVFVPSGEFLMGAGDKDPITLSSERPQISVYLDGYWIDRTEVTNQKYSEFLNGIGNLEHGGATWLDVYSDHVRIHQVDDIWQPAPGYEHHPVVEVTWFGAKSYCQWLGKRLPTESEWEKAAPQHRWAKISLWGWNYL